MGEAIPNPAQHMGCQEERAAGPSPRHVMPGIVPSKGGLHRAHARDALGRGCRLMRHVKDAARCDAGRHESSSSSSSNCTTTRKHGVELGAGIRPEGGGKRAADWVSQAESGTERRPFSKKRIARRARAADCRRTRTCCCDEWVVFHRANYLLLPGKAVGSGVRGTSAPCPHIAHQQRSPVTRPGDKQPITQRPHHGRLALANQEPACRSGGACVIPDPCARSSKHLAPAPHHRPVQNLVHQSNDAEGGRVPDSWIGDGAQQDVSICASRAHWSSWRQLGRDGVPPKARCVAVGRLAIVGLIVPHSSNLRLHFFPFQLIFSPLLSSAQRVSFLIVGSSCRHCCRFTSPLFHLFA